MEIDGVESRMKEDGPSRTRIEERDVEFECFGSTLAVDVEGDGKRGVAVQDLAPGTQLDLHGAIVGECCAPDHHPELFGEVAEEGELGVCIVGMLFEDINGGIGQESGEC